MSGSRQNAQQKFLQLIHQKEQSVSIETLRFLIKEIKIENVDLKFNSECLKQIVINDRIDIFNLLQKMEMINDFYQAYILEEPHNKLIPNAKSVAMLQHIINLGEELDAPAAPAGINILSQGEQLLYNAAGNNSYELCHYLIEKQINPNVHVFFNDEARTPFKNIFKNHFDPKHKPSLSLIKLFLNTKNFQVTTGMIKDALNFNHKPILGEHIQCVILLLTKVQLNDFCLRLKESIITLLLNFIKASKVKYQEAIYLLKICRKENYFNNDALQQTCESAYNQIIQETDSRLMFISELINTFNDLKISCPPNEITSIIVEYTADGGHIPSSVYTIGFFASKPPLQLTEAAYLLENQGDDYISDDDNGFRHGWTA